MSVTPIRSKRRRGWLRQWPITVVLVVVAVALVVVALGYFRRGSVLLAGAVLLAFFLRLFLSDREAGWLVVRSKRVDLIVLATLGLLLAVLSFWVPPPN